jgi:hypothetical protein
MFVLQQVLILLKIVYEANPYINNKKGEDRKGLFALLYQLLRGCDVTKNIYH